MSPRQPALNHLSIHEQAGYFAVIGNYIGPGSGPMDWAFTGAGHFSTREEAEAYVRSQEDADRAYRASVGLPLPEHLLPLEHPKEQTN